MKKHCISPNYIHFFEIEDILENNRKLELSEESKEAIIKCRNYLNQKMGQSDAPVYGINTGFGSLCNTKVNYKDLSNLQRNLMISHACGFGEEVPQNIVKIMLFLKIQSLSYGHSGAALETVQRLIDFYNNNVYPIVYQQGSLGASGDLAPLAHLCLPLIGLGEVYYKNKKYKAEEINQKFGWDPLTLQSKEGLALLNGTQFMSAYSVWLILKAERLSLFADLIGSISLDAFDGRIEPFDDRIQDVRPHQGQVMTGFYVNTFLKDSEIIQQPKMHVQDPYSFRCMPQVHGATKNALEHIADVINTEINSVTDNPTIFPEDDTIISAGNFHGQPLALVLDYLTMAMAELGNISERRIYQLISGKRGLPSFLVKNPGLNSGFMIPQYTAASIVNQNKSLTMPCSTDSIESSQGQEDHVSMGANAATKAYRVLDNVEKILAIELFNAAQALEFRRPLKSSPIIESFIADYRKAVPFVENDTIMYKLMHQSQQFIQKYALDNILDVLSAAII
jgi:histidine ammonia-lyase